MQILSEDGLSGSLRPGLASIPHQTLCEPADLYDALRQSAPITHCRNLVPDGQFLHQVGALTIGSTVLISQCGTPTEFLIEDTPEFHLITCFQGGLQLATAGGKITLEANTAALLPTGLRHSNGSHSLASITLHPAAVASAASAMAGRPSPTLNGGSAFAPRLLEAKDLDVVHGLLHHIDACTAISPHLSSHLALDDVLHRTAAVLLHPELLEQEPPDLHRSHDPAGRSNFDDLIDFIRSNLDQRLSLSELEARSHYSRRALQYTFRQRLNSTPKQWIREQRLTLAMDQLRQDGLRPSIKAVALQCGYTHLGHFSRDFRTRFGVTPSEARRG
jgi:AraC-like DNA-binding protein